MSSSSRTKEKKNRRSKSGFSLLSSLLLSSSLSSTNVFNAENETISYPTSNNTLIQTNENDIDISTCSDGDGSTDIDHDSTMTNISFKEVQEKEDRGQNHEIQVQQPDSSIQSIILLNFVAVIWGTQHAFIKMVVEDCDSSIFSFSRFVLAAIIATVGPLLFETATTTATTNTNDEKDLDRSMKNDSNIGITENGGSISASENNESNANAWRWGIEMGFWMFLGYAFQAVGLEYTTAQRSGFLLYLNIKLVPLFAYLIYQRQISIPTWISALTALTGTALLTFDGSAYDFNIGDAWSIAAAAASAMFILRLEFASKAVSDSSKLNSYSLWVVTFASFIWCLYDGISMTSGEIVGGNDSVGPFAVTLIESIWEKVVGTISQHPFELVYLGGVTTALANYIQTKAQKGISAERASIIYALDPVYGAFFCKFTSWRKVDTVGQFWSCIDHSCGCYKCLS